LVSSDYEWGDLLIKRGDKEGAGKVYQKIVALYNPSSLSAQNIASCSSSWGNVLHTRQFPGMALEIYKKDIAANPRNAAIYVGIGKILQEQGKFKEAVSAYRQAIEIDPNTYGAYKKVIDAIEK
jgi:tetratricopeptide (TPR) repeat protein